MTARWSIFPAARFEALATRWDEANSAAGDHPLLDSRFVGALVRRFGGARTRLAVAEGARAPGLALLEPGRLGLWQTFQPSQAPLGLIVLGDRADVLAQTHRLVRALPGYALSLSVLQQDPDASAFTGVEAGPTTEWLDYIRTARLIVRGPFEPYWRGRSRNLIHNLTRQRKRLAERGARLELSVERDPSRVADAIRDYGRLEGEGWKAGMGTAVTADNEQGRFYREVLEDFCARDQGAIYRLLLDGRSVAMDLCLERNGMLAILKTAYDESVAGLSLGLLLHQEVFAQAFAEGRLKVIEFYGRLREWHTKWTDEVRDMRHVTVYRHAWCPRALRLARRLRPGPGAADPPAEPSPGT